MVEVGTGSSGSRFLKTKWPIAEGLTAGTTKQEGNQENLIAEEADLVPQEERKGVTE